MQENQEYMQEQDERGLIKLSGSIEHVIYANEDNGYAIRSVNPVVCECNDASLNDIRHRCVGQASRKPPA